MKLQAAFDEGGFQHQRKASPLLHCTMADRIVRVALERDVRLVRRIQTSNA